MSLLDIINKSWVKRVALATSLLTAPFLMNGCGKQTLTSPEEPTAIVETIPQEGGIIETEGYTLTFEEDTFTEPTDVTISYPDNQLETPENATQLEEQIHISIEHELQKPVQLTHENQGTFARYNEETQGWDKIQTTDKALTDQFSFWSFFDWSQSLGCECDTPEESPDIENQLDLFGSYVDHRCNLWATYKDILRQYFIEGNGLPDQVLNIHLDFLADTSWGLIDFHNTLSNVTGFGTENYLNIIGDSYSIYQENYDNFTEIQSDLDGLPDDYDILLLGLISPQGAMARQLANTSSGKITGLINQIHDEDFEHERFPTRLPIILQSLRSQASSLERIMEGTEIINFRSGEDNPYGNSSLTNQFGINPTQADIELAERIKELAQNDLIYVTEAASHIQNIVDPFKGKIVFVRKPGDEYEIYSVNLNDPENQTILTEDISGHSYDPKWSPNGEKILFTNAGRIMTMDPNGENKTFITIGYRASWSPDGEEIAYNYWENYLKVKNLNTHQTETIFEGLPTLSPTWSPNGEEIAFAVRENDEEIIWNIYKINRDKTGLRKLTDLDTYDNFPAWSPDGEEIAFTSIRGESTYHDIYIMDSNGNNQRPLVNTHRVELQPAWSPDGNHVIFNSNLFGPTDIFIVERNGEGLTKILENGYDVSLTTE
jgi:Tol biopolymer transport system component